MTARPIQVWNGSAWEDVAVQAIDTVSTNGGSTITASGAAVKPLILKGAASQSVNLLEVQQSDGTVGFRVSPSGVPLSASGKGFGILESTNNNTWYLKNISNDLEINYNSNAATVVIDSATGLITGTGTSLGAWTAYTPTVTAGTGSFTTVSAAGRWCQIGKTVIGNANITITTNGTAAASVGFTLPVNGTGFALSIGSGRAASVSGKQLQVVSANATTATIYNYDNSYPGASGEVLRVNFIYEAA